MVMADFPKTACSFYIKLYCMKRKKSKNKGNYLVTEAVKSWSLLSKSEKKKFIDKYEQCQTGHRVIIANSLKNAQPFMIKKMNQRQKKDDRNTNLVINGVHNLEQSSMCPTLINESQDTKENNNITSLNICVNELQDINEHEVSSNNEENITHVYPLKEPSPPQLMRGRDLFEIIKSANDSSDVNWQSLAKNEKQIYQVAVRSIKNEYINKYKAYLESLKSLDLYKFYIKSFNK